MNALFGMRSKISIGDRTIVATATATACLLSCLPRPSQPKLICTASSGRRSRSWIDQEKIKQIKKR